MQVKFYSELLDEYFDTKDACAKAEAKIKTDKQKYKELYKSYLKAAEEYETARHNLKAAEKEYFDFKSKISNYTEANTNKPKPTDEEVNDYIHNLLKYIFST